MALLTVARYMQDRFLPSASVAESALALLANQEVLASPLLLDSVLTPLPSMGQAYVAHPHFNYVVLAGPRGSGKSTIVRTIEYVKNSGLPPSLLAQYPKMPAIATYYLDVRKYDERIRVGKDPSAMHPVCEVLHELIREQIVGPLDNMSKSMETKVERFERDLSEFELHSRMTNECILFDDMLRKRLGSVGMKSVQKRRNAVEKDSRLADLRFEAERSYLLLRGDHKLAVLLRFLAEKGHSCHIIVDNLDRFSSRLQAAVDKVALNKANTHANAFFTIPLRSGNVDRLSTSAHENPREVIWIAGPRSIGGEVRPDAASTETGISVAEVSATSGAGTATKLANYTAIATRRIRLFQRCLETQSLQVYIAAHVDPELRRIGVGDSERHVKEILDAFLGRDDRFRSVLSLTANTVLQWHNYSIRGSLAQMADLMALTIQGQDQFFGRPEGYERRFERRDFVSILYRQMIFGESAGGRSGFTLVKVFREEVVPSEGSVRFPRLRLLQLLSQNGGRMRWSEICHWFELEGYGSDTILGCLVDLARGRGWESEGLIRVDGIQDLPTWFDSAKEMQISEPTSTPLLRGNREVKLRSAGRLFMRNIVPSVEYLFWCALEVDSLPNVLNQRGQISEQMILRDEYRAKVALKFIEQELLPAARAEVRTSSGQVDPQRVSKFAKDLAPTEFGGDYKFIKAALSNIRRFIDEADPPFAEEVALIATVARLRKHL